MQDLSLSIFDLAENGVKAGATAIGISVDRDEGGFLAIRIEDNGCGMDEEQLKKVRDPFYTTRTTRKVGLGIPLIDMLCSQCGGHLELSSRKGVGTRLCAFMEKDSIDLPPMGDLGQTVKVLVAAAPKVELKFSYRAATGRNFVFDTRQVREVLGDDADLSDARVAEWIGAYLDQEIKRADSALEEGEKL